MVPGCSGEGDGDDEGCVEDREVAGRRGLLAGVDEAAVDSGVAALVVLLHGKNSGGHQKMQGSAGGRKGESGGFYGDEAHRKLLEKAAEVAAPASKCGGLGARGGVVSWGIGGGVAEGFIGAIKEGDRRVYGRN